MDTNTIASAHAGNRNLSTDPRRMAVTKVWGAMMCGARKYCELKGLTRQCECVPFLINRDNVF